MRALASGIDLAAGPKWSGSRAAVTDNHISSRGTNPHEPHAVSGVSESTLSCYHVTVKHALSSSNANQAACPSGLRERIAIPTASQSQQEVTGPVQQDCSSPEVLNLAAQLSKLTKAQRAGLKALLDGLLGQRDKD